MIFSSDSKNYHAWSYRLWFIERFELWDEELDFVDFFLNEQEVTNNSLWSYRYFLKSKRCPFTKELVEEELQYAQQLLEKKDMMNEAAWVYLKGWLALTKEEEGIKGNTRRWPILDFPELKTWCLRLLESNRDNRFLYILLADIAVAEGDKETAIEYLKVLRTVVDRLRENYYLWRINKL